MAAGFEVFSDVKKEVQQCFDKIRETVNMREKLLLRQIDVIASQSQNANSIQSIHFSPENVDDLVAYIRTFGKFNLDNIHFSTDLYANEDYISPSIDHETMYKCLQSRAGYGGSRANGNEEQIVVDFSCNKKLIKENVNNINESIVNITLNEAKELIRKARPAQQNIDLDKEVVSQSSQTDGKAKNINANITINNCNGTINMKNISNLTINCVTEDSLSAENKALSTESEEQQNDYEISGSPSDVSSTKDNENNSVNCEFYSRLISEIKNSLKQGHRPNIESIPLGHRSIRKTNSNETDSSSTESYNRRYLLKNFENLKIVLENNENDAHPVQIEQWLTEIISETEVEPMQNTEILEHSKIHGKELC